MIAILMNDFHKFCIEQAMESAFCKPCTHNLQLNNGIIRYLEDRAFHYCSAGYRLVGPSIRKCLRTSKWSLPAPYCQSNDFYLFFFRILNSSEKGMNKYPCI